MNRIEQFEKIETELRERSKEIGYVDAFAKLEIDKAVDTVELWCSDIKQYLPTFLEQENLLDVMVKEYRKIYHLYLLCGDITDYMRGVVNKYHEGNGNTLHSLYKNVIGNKIVSGIDDPDMRRYHECYMDLFEQKLALGKIIRLIIEYTTQLDEREYEMREYIGRYVKQGGV